MVMDSCDNKWDIFIHFICFNAGLWAVLGGVAGFLSDNTAFQDVIVSIYLIFFGCIVLLFQVKVFECFSELIKFYDTFVGRAFSYFFLGSLPLGRSTFADVCGAFILISAFLLIIMLFIKYFQCCRNLVEIPDDLPLPLMNNATDKRKDNINMSTGTIKNVQNSPPQPPQNTQNYNQQDTYNNNQQQSYDQQNYNQQQTYEQQNYNQQPPQAPQPPLRGPEVTGQVGHNNNPYDEQNEYETYAPSGNPFKPTTEKVL